MFEFDWKKNKTVYRNLLGIKGISHTTAKKLCALLGISNNTLYSQLASHKIDLLNLLLNLYNKKTNVLTINSLSDLIDSTVSETPYNSPIPPKEEKIDLRSSKGFPSLTKSALGAETKGKKGQDVSLRVEKQWVEEGNMIHTPIQNSLNTLRKENILSLIHLNTYRGRRYKFGYPVKGQRTRSNARTARKLNRIKYS